MANLLGNYWKYFSIFILAFGIAWIGFTTSQTVTSTQGLIPAPRQGFLAPDFSLEDLQGKLVSLNALRGKVVVVNIWATWCAFCKSEMPAFQNVSSSYASNTNVVILAVNSTIQDDPSKIEPFVKEYGLQYPILLDKTGTATRAYQVQALPTTFFIDRQGIIKNVTIGGPLTEAMIRAQIESLLESE